MLALALYRKLTMGFDGWMAIKYYKRKQLRDLVVVLFKNKYN
jgi:hypothetical protein